MINFVKTVLKDVGNLPQNNNFSVIIENFLFLDPFTLQLYEKPEFKPYLDLLKHVECTSVYFEILMTTPKPWTVMKNMWAGFEHSCRMYLRQKKMKIKGFVLKFASNFLLEPGFVEAVKSLNSVTCVIVEPTVLMFNQMLLLKELANGTNYLVLPGQGYFESNVKAMEIGTIHFLKPAHHAPINSIRSFLENVEGISKDKFLLQLPTSGIEFEVYDDTNVLNVRNISRSECIIAAKLHGEENWYESNLDPGYSHMTMDGENPRKKLNYDLYYDGPEQIKEKLKVFIDELGLTGVVIESLEFDLATNHPESIYHMVQQKYQQYLQNQAEQSSEPISPSLSPESPHKQPTSVSIGNDETDKPEEKDNTVPEENEEIFDME
jgi:hypothetical protein